MKILTEDYMVHNMDSNKYVTATMSNKPETYPIPYTTDLRFDKRIGLVAHYIKYETELDEKGNEQGITSEDKAKKRAVEDFYLNHPNIVINGKPHKFTKNPVFTLQDSALQVVEELVDFDIELRVATRINDMSLDELQNVCYFFGDAPGGRTKGELKVLLAGKNGLCYNKSLAGGKKKSNVQMFTEVWMKKEADADRDMRVMLRKAIDLKVIANNKKNDLDLYFLGDTQIGSSVDDLMAYFHKEDRMYKEFVVKAVEEKYDNTKADKDSEMLEKALEAGILNNMDESKIAAMRNEAKELKRLGFIPKTFSHHLAKVENLEKELEAGRKAKAKSEEKVEA